jgi:hypothetical protein
MPEFPARQIRPGDISLTQEGLRLNPIPFAKLWQSVLSTPIFTSSNIHFPPNLS